MCSKLDLEEMVGRRHLLALFLVASGLGCSQILDLNSYSARPDPSSSNKDSGSNGQPDGGPLPACTVDLTSSCSCAANCSQNCPKGNCTFECTSGASCFNSCDGAGCTFICRAGSTCLDSCAGGGCTFVCDPAATCDNTCAGGNCK